MNATTPQYAIKSQGGVWRSEILGTVDHRHHLHGLRRQSAVRLTLFVIPSTPNSTGARGHPGGVHDFLLIETWLVPVEGYLVDRFGPKWVVLGGGILVGIAWVMNSVASSLAVLYAAAAIGGIGTGCVYGTCVGNALKWFPGRRALPPA